MKEEFIKKMIDAQTEVSQHEQRAHELRNMINVL
jgi:hypothetical protein